MAAHPGDRYASAADLAQELERFSGAGGGRGGMIFRLASPFLTVELRWAVSIALVLGVGFWTMMLGPPFFLSAPREAAQSTAFDGKLEFDVRVWTAGAKDPVPLLEAVPLESGAKVQIRGRVPRGSHVALFWLDCDGAPYDLSKDRVTVPVPSAAEVYYPGPDKSVALEGSAGTVVLLLCARRMGGEIMPEEISEVLAEGKAWPAMAEPATVVEFDSERVQVHRRDRGAPRPAGAAGAINDVPDTVRRRAEQLRLQLADRFEYVRGVAFTYRGQAE